MPDMKTFTANGITYDIRDSRLEAKIEEVSAAMKTYADAEVANGISQCAPADLGETKTADWSKVDEIIDNGWYRFGGDLTIDGAEIGWCYMSVGKWDDDSVTQTLYSSKHVNCSLKRSKNPNGWYPWEWINPLMEIGVEYRTTERHMGKAVYTKLVDCGALPNNSVKYAVHNAALTQALRCAAYLVGSDTLPVEFDTSGWRVNVTCGAECVCVETYSDMSYYTVRAQIWYIKD